MSQFDQPAGGFPQNNPGYGAPTQEHPDSQMVFIMGIIGIFFGILAFIAWYKGNAAKKEIEAGAPYAWDGNIKTGYLLGKVFSIIYIVVAALYIIGIIVIAIVASGAS